MSAASLAQLTESYMRVISDTLKHVRETGLLRDTGREVLDELETRWRAATGKELASMEARVSKRQRSTEPREQHEQQSEPVPPPAGVTEQILSGRLALSNAALRGQPANMSATLQRRPPSSFSLMKGVSFAEPFALPALQGVPPVPALQCGSEGFLGSHVQGVQQLEAAQEATATAVVAGREAMTYEDEEPPRKMQKGTSREAKELAPPLDALGPPLPAKPSSSSQPQVLEGGAGPSIVPVAADASAQEEEEEEDDEEYGGLFDGADVVLSSAAAAEAARQPQGAGNTADAAAEQQVALMADGAGSDSSHSGSARSAASSPGSELGSDLDDSEFDEPDTENILFAEVAQVQKTQKVWKLKFKEGVLHIGGVECLFSSGSCTLQADGTNMTVPTAPEALGALEDGEENEGA